MDKEYLAPSEKLCIEIRLYEISVTKENKNLTITNQEDSKSIGTNEDAEINYS